MMNIQREIEKIEQIVTPEEIEKLAIMTKLQIKKPRKLDPWSMIKGFLHMSFSSISFSYAAWAGKISQIIKQNVTAVAVFKKFYWVRKTDQKATGERFIEFLKSLVDLLLERCQKKDKKKIIIPGVNKILLQDSTCLKLQGKFKDKYPGNENKFNEVDKSVLKIDTIYDVANGRFERFHISGFTENDQFHSKDMLEYASPKDLVIRDLGFSSLRVFKTLSEKNIYFVSKLKYGTTIFDKDTGEKLTVRNLAKNKELVDMQVKIGSDVKLPVRLLIFRASESVKAKRINNALKDRDRRLNHSEDFFDRLGYTVLITNLPKSLIKDEQIILRLYQVRWRIESIFKSWKSYFNIEEIEKFDNLIQLESYIYMMIVYFMLFNEQYLLFIKMKPKTEKRDLSLLKLSKYITENFWEFWIEKIKSNSLIDLVYASCCYQKRKDQIHFPDLIASLS